MYRAPVRPARHRRTQAENGPNYRTAPRARHARRLSGRMHGVDTASARFQSRPAGRACARALGYRQAADQANGPAELPGRPRATRPRPNSRRPASTVVANRTRPRGRRRQAAPPGIPKKDAAHGGRPPSCRVDPERPGRAQTAVDHRRPLSLRPPAREPTKRPPPPPGPGPRPRCRRWAGAVACAGPGGGCRGWCRGRGPRPRRRPIPRRPPGAIDPWRTPAWATYGVFEYDKLVGATVSSPIVTGPGGAFGLGLTYSFAMTGLPFGHRRVQLRRRAHHRRVGRQEQQCDVAGNREVAAAMVWGRHEGAARMSCHANRRDRTLRKLWKHTVFDVRMIR